MPVCDVYRLQALVDGQLSEAEARLVTQHVQGCQPCTQLLAGLQSLVALTHRPPEPAPEGLQDRLLAAVAGLEPLRRLDCHTALELASQRLDGELPLDECRRLEAHLDACATCACAVAEMALTDDLLRSIEPQAAPAGLLQRLERATSAVSQRASRPTVWQLWARSAAGMAAAAALLVALLTNLSQAPAPMVAQLPPPQPTVSLATPKPAAEPAPVAVAAAPARPMSFETLRRAALSVTSPRPAQAAPRAIFTVVPAPAVVRPSAPVRTAPAPVVAPNPQPAAPIAPAPVAVAVAPARPEETPAPRVVALTPPARVDEAPAPAPVVAVAPVQPVRVAIISKPKVTNAVTVSPKPARRPTWVSRPASEEREIYTADRDETRLADARRDLDQDIRVMRDGEVKGFVIH